MVGSLEWGVRRAGSKPLRTHLVTSVITSVTDGTLWEGGLLGALRVTR